MVRNPTTHTGGTALDVHIAEKAWTYKATVHAIPKKFSDHSISMVGTDITVH